MKLKGGCLQHTPSPAKAGSPPGGRKFLLFVKNLTRDTPFFTLPGGI